MRTNWNKFSTQLLINILEQDNNPVEICDLICELTKRKVHSSRVRDILRELSKSTIVFWNDYTISDFALAALDLMEWDSYKGNRKEVITLIASGLNFA
jgi:glycosylphosphatidylinositol transamidase (GPIT) subunit GPI8